MIFTKAEMESLLIDPKKHQPTFELMAYRDYLISYLVLFMGFDYYKICNIKENNINTYINVCLRDRINYSFSINLFSYLIIKYERIHKHNGSTTYFYNPSLFTTMANKSLYPQSVAHILKKHMEHRCIANCKVQRYHRTSEYIKKNNINSLDQY